jgi:LPXTG-motif cell wall-anchored protein
MLALYDVASTAFWIGLALILGSIAIYFLTRRK